MLISEVAKVGDILHKEKENVKAYKDNLVEVRRDFIDSIDNSVEVAYESF